MWRRAQGGGNVLLLPAEKITFLPLLSDSLKQKVFYNSSSRKQAKSGLVWFGVRAAGNT